MAFLEMLCRTDGRTIRICQATPRKWLEHGKEIKLERFYTEYGPMSFQIKSALDQNKITAEIEPAHRNAYDRIVIRLRTPGERKIKSVTVNGKSHNAFDSEREEITLMPGKDKLDIVVAY